MQPNIAGSCHTWPRSSNLPQDPLYKQCNQHPIILKDQLSFPRPCYTPFPFYVAALPIIPQPSYPSTKQWIQLCDAVEPLLIPPLIMETPFIVSQSRRVSPGNVFVVSTPPIHKHAPTLLQMSVADTLRGTLSAPRELSPWFVLSSSPLCYPMHTQSETSSFSSHKTCSKQILSKLSLSFPSWPCYF